jgi:hypothetical protein
MAISSEIFLVSGTGKQQNSPNIPITQPDGLKDGMLVQVFDMIFKVKQDNSSNFYLEEGSLIGSVCFDKSKSTWVCTALMTNTAFAELKKE